MGALEQSGNADSAARRAALTWAVLKALAIVLVVFAAYATSATAPFMSLDDPLYVVKNLRVQTPGLAGLAAVWNPGEAYAGRFVEYFPLRDSLYWAVWQGFGPNPVPFHLLNLFAHAGCSLLVGVLARRVGFSSRVAFFASLLFAVHPQHLESVAWVSGLKDPMYTSCLLGVVWCWDQYLGTARKRWFASAMALLVMALLTKSMAFIAPGLLLLVELCRPGAPRPGWRRLVVPTALAAAFLVHFLLVGRANQVLIGPYGGSWPAHITLVFWVFARYLQQALVPFDFRIHYCFSAPDGLLDVRFALGALAALSYAFALIRLRRFRRVFFCLAWFPICLLPAMNIIPFPALMADRYLYASSVAVCIAIAFALDRVSRSGLRTGLAIAVVAGLGGVTAVRGSLWHDEIGLWRAVLEDEACEPYSYPRVKLGDALIARDPAMALAAYQQALDANNLAGLNPAAKCVTLLNAVYLALHFDRLELAGGYQRQLEATCAGTASAFEGRGALHEWRGEVPEQLEAFERASALQPSASLIWVRGVSRFQLGRVDEAAADLRAVLRANGTYCRSYAALQALSASQTEALARLQTLIGPLCEAQKVP